MQPGQTTNSGGGTMEVVAAAPRCQLLLIVLMAAMLLPGMKGSPLLVQRTVTRTFVLQESISKVHRIYLNGEQLRESSAWCRGRRAVWLQQDTVVMTLVTHWVGVQLTEGRERSRVVSGFPNRINNQLPSGKTAAECTTAPLSFR
ncbi:hypothetical protein STEG23_023579 [Scotinomys teguina]